MAWYITSGYKPPLKVILRKYLHGGAYASLEHPFHPGGPIVVPSDQLEERIELDDIL